MKAILILLLGIVIESASLAATSTLRETGRYPAFQGKSNRMRIVGAYGYVAANTEGFVILNLTDPATPTPVGSCQFTGEATDVAVVGTTAYVATLGYGIKRIDITTPSAPRVVAEIAAPESFVALAAYQNHLYALPYSGLRVFNISNPASIRQVGNVVFGGATDIAVSDGYAFVLAASTGLNIYDVGNPAAPVRVGGYNTPGTAVSLHMPHSGSAYIADGQNGALLVRTSNRTSPHLEETYDTDGYCYAVAQYGGRLLTASNPGGLEVFNDFNGQREGGLRAQNATAKALTHKGIYAYVSFGSSGLQVVDLKIDYLPDWSSGYGDGQSARDIDIIQDRAFVSWLQGGVQVIDVKDRRAPRKLTTLHFGSTVYGVGADYFYAYPAYGGYVSVYMMNNVETTPTFTPIGGQYAPNSFVWDVEATPSGPIAAAGTAGIARMTTQSNFNRQMIVESRFDTPGSANDIESRDGLAYVADGESGLQIIQIDSPQFTRRGFVNTPGYASAVVLGASTAFVADGSAGLQVIDVSDPAQPRIRSTLDTPGSGAGIAVNGDRVYVADGTSVQIIDVSNLDAPRLVESLPLEDARDVAVNGSTLYVANGFRGFRIYEILPEVRLEMRRVNANYELKWPEAHGNFKLQYSHDVSPPNWQNHPATPQLINAEWTVPIHAFDGLRYFRLAAD